MKSLSWEKYCEKVYDWSPSTEKNYLRRLTDYGPSEAVFEIAIEFVFHDKEFGGNKGDGSLVCWYRLLRRSGND